MSNHIHLIWQPINGFTPSNVQASFMKHTSKQLLRLIRESNPIMLDDFKVNKGDREFQIWKREPLGTELFYTRNFLPEIGL